MVFPAVYGYWSTVTSIPRARAAAITSRTRSAYPCWAVPEILKCEMCSGIPSEAPMSKNSSSAPQMSRPSLRMWATNGRP